MSLVLISLYQFIVYGDEIEEICKASEKDIRSRRHFWNNSPLFAVAYIYKSMQNINEASNMTGGTNERQVLKIFEVHFVGCCYSQELTREKYKCCLCQRKTVRLEC